MLKINLRQLDNEGEPFAGTIRVEELALEVTDPSIDLSFGEEVEYNLHVSSVSEGVLVAGTVSVDINTECGRCLCKYTFRLNLNDVCHFYEEVQSDNLDISDDIREDILIALPSKLLCDEECKGLCTHCGCNLNNKTCNCTDDSNDDFDKEVNPWSALDNLDV